MKYIDLHTHTIYSDGISSPAELVRAAKLKGIEILAKTDHDNINGYEEAKNEAEKWGLKLISGAEFTSKKYHILGLNFDVKNKKILELLDRSKNLQREACRQRTDILENYGVPISIEKVEGYFPKSRIGKYNILMAMLIDKECRNWLYEKHGDASPDEIRDFYLTKKGIAAKLENRPALENEEIIKTIHKAGGIAIFAHPLKDINAFSYTLRDVDNLSELDAMKEIGIDGLEIQPSFHSEKDSLIEKYAKDNNLLITYGSDYHGPNFNRPLLGRGMNKVNSRLEGILS